MTFVEDKTSLNKIFRLAVALDENITINLEDVQHLLFEDLKLDITHLTNAQVSTLPYMLISYIRKWPGWEKRNEYENGSLDLESWYDRFRKYIMYKMSLLITKTLVTLDNNLEREEETKKQVTSSTQLSDRATFSNFNIEITGPASLLSKLVFWGVGDDISIEEHSERPWVPIDSIQLLNYPYVEVEFNSPELSFKRSFEPRVTRYISGCADMLYEKPSFILGKHRMNTTTPLFIFPTSLLEEYITFYKQSMFPQISPKQQEELSVILNQFYADMLDIKFNNCIAENRQVSFNIGKNIFKRSKKISNPTTENAGSPVIFNEVFLPKMTSSFRYFTGMQEYTSEGKRMVSSNKSNLKMMNFKPIIHYRCLYCKLNFLGPDGQNDIINHLEKDHKREQPLLCLLCKTSFEVTDLAKQRWKCTCQS